MTDLRALLGERYEETVKRAADALFLYRWGHGTPAEYPDYSPYPTEAAVVLAAVLPDLLVEAWEKGHRDGRFDAAVNAVRENAEHVTTPNPYRTSSAAV